MVRTLLRGSLAGLMFCLLSGVDEPGALVAQTKSGGVTTDQVQCPLPEDCVPGVGVFPDGVVPAPFKTHSSGQLTFTVQNLGRDFDTYALTCSFSGQVVSCPPSLGAVTINGISTADIPIDFTTGGQGPGTLTLTATSTLNSGVSDIGFYTVQVDSFGVRVTPDAQATTRAPNSSLAERFTVENTGSTTVTFALAQSCSGFVTCSAPSLTSVSLGSGVTTDVTVPYTTGAGGTGVVGLQAGSANASDGGTYNVSVIFSGVTVTPDGGTEPARRESTGGYKAVFQVTNTGNGPATFAMTCTAGGGVTCTALSSTSLTVPANGTVPDTATYSVGLAGTGSLGLTAVVGAISDAGSYAVPIVRYAVAVSPHDSAGPNQTINGQGFTSTFFVKNTGTGTETYSLTCSATGAVQCTSVSPSSVTLGSQVTQVVTVTNSAPGMGPGTLTLQATGSSGFASDAGSYRVTVVDPAPPNPRIIATSGGTATVGPESGPYSYTVTIRNNGGSTPAQVTVQCVTLASQMPCETPSPNSFSLSGGGAIQVVTVPYHAIGLGSFQQKIKVLNGAIPIPNDSTVVGPILVAGAPIVQHVNPPDGGDLSTADSLRVMYSHASGIDTSKVRVWLNGVDRTISVVKTATGYTAAATALALPGGVYRWTTYGCSVSGRCDSVSTTIYSNTPTNYALDDSLPPTSDPQGTGTLLGPLAPPPDGLRGCASDLGDPEITFTGPTSYLNQSSPSGRIYVATIDTSAIALTASTQALAWLGNRSKRCSDLTILQRSQFDYTFFASLPPNDPRWNSYPYGDLAWVVSHPSQWGLLFEPVELAFGGPRTGPSPFDPGATPWREIDEAVGASAPAPSRVSRPTARVTAASRLRPAAAMLPDPGPIDSTSYRLELNGVVLVDHSQVVAGAAGTGVMITRMTRLFQDVSIPVNHPNLNSTAQGGWNEMVASIKDTAGRVNSVRTRFVYDRTFQTGPVQALAVATLRDFTHLDQGQCAAFGTFQCDGVMLTATIPGFVTRDKERALHLVYRSGSQRQPTLIPLKVNVAKAQKAPDSLTVTPVIGGVEDSTNLRRRYAGVKGSVTGPNASLLNESRDEERIIGVEIPAPASGNASIRTVKHKVRSWYPTGTPPFIADSIMQDVVQIFLSDTLVTRFGQGWQLAEVSRLVLGQSFGGNAAAVYLAGDGTFEVFRQPAGTTSWTSPPGESSRLVTLSTADAGALFVLYLDNGASVGFRADGWQVWTRDLVGNATTFHYRTTTSSRLDSIADPAGKKFIFRYPTSTTAKHRGNPQSVYLRFSGTAGDTATVALFEYDTLTNPAAARLKKVALRRSAASGDTLVTRYTYFGGSAPGAFVDSVIDPRDSTGRRVVTRFTYDPLLWTPDRVTRPNGGLAYVRTPWRRAVPRVGYGRPGNALERMVQNVQHVGTFVPFAGTPTDYTVDLFGGPTMVRHFATTGDPSQRGLEGDDIRHIVTDSAGRPLRVVRNRWSPAKADSVVYHYDALGRVDSLIRSTLEYKRVGQTRGLDTLSFVYDSVTLVAGKSWCSRLLVSKDAMARPTTFLYGASGVGRCLPLRVIGLARDTAVFTYGPLTAGSVAGARPITTRDANGLKDSVAYHAATWNSEFFIRQADAAITRAFYDRFGRADSVVDPVGVRTWFIRDRLGQVTHQQVGKGSLAPVSRTVYDRGGLVTRVDVYAPLADNDITTLPTNPANLQTTYTYFNALGWRDSTVGPGSRTATASQPQARKEAFSVFDGFGNPRWQYTGNGSYVSRVYDRQGRLSGMELSQVRPGFSVNGERFADSATVAMWDSLILPSGKVQHVGGKHTYRYDAKGMVVADSSYDLFTGYTDPVAGPKPYTDRRYGYSRTGALVADTLDFGRNGATVVRYYEYNRRGQRTLATDSIFAAGLSNGPSPSPERAGQIQYWYDSLTARLDSVVGSAGSGRYASVRWAYDRGGRDTLRAVALANPSTPAAEVVTRIQYDVAGRIGGLTTSNTAGWNGGKTWYAMASPLYNKVNELLRFTLTQESPKSGLQQFIYDTTGTRRLLTASEGLMGNSWTYDVWGNRKSEVNNSGVASDQCKNIPRTLSYGIDNRILSRSGFDAPSGEYCAPSRYFSDQNGNRLVEADTTKWNPPSLPPLQGLTSLSSYTASNQLYFSFTPAGVGKWDFNWHWYDAQGRRVMTQVTEQDLLYPLPHPDSVGPSRTYYVYDGSDVALVLLRSGGTWSVDSRLLVGGVDLPLAGRFRMTGGLKNIALVSDRGGTLIEAVNNTGNRETDATYIRKDAYGALAGIVSTTQIPQPLGGAGFAGAGTPNSRGGFVYMRNRWYDPITGRFLTQDPIGLAGGVNLYAYAGNNPIAFDDPYGLAPGCIALPCPPSSVIGGLLAGAARVLGSALSTIGTATLAVISTVLVTSDEGKREPKHVFHRRPVNPREVLLVAASGELHGKAAGNIYASDNPAVKAYQGPLPPGMPGYEFTTAVTPDPGSPGMHRMGGQVNWSGDRPGVRKVDDETVAIPVTVTKVVAP